VCGVWCVCVVCVCLCVCVCVSMNRWDLDLDGEVREELEMRRQNPTSPPLAPTLTRKNLADRVSLTDVSDRVSFTHVSVCFTHVSVSVCLTFRGFRKDLMAGILSIRWRMRRRRRACPPLPAPPCKNMFSLGVCPLSSRARVRFRETMFFCLGEDLEA
jgi:hypothetical protein